MLKSALVFIFLSLLSQLSFANSNQYWSTEDLLSQKECLLVIARQQMHSLKNTPAPDLKIESETPLIEFQDAMAEHWHFRPDFFLNVFAVQKNTIYLMNKKASYKSPRTPYDSLVHELVHFVQQADFGGTGDEDYMENEAVRIQTWFRETYGQHVQNEKYKGPCDSQ